MAKLVLTDEDKKDLGELLKHFEDEDKSTRERQIRSWRRLKLMWDGFQRVWYSETAHDWRIWDEQQDNDANQQDYYNQPINVFRAYLESIIAALSISVPAIKCYPDDADNALDLLTAKAGDKIGELISRHNNVTLLWIHALYIYCTEGMVACYNYTDEDEKYGTFTTPKYKDVEVNKTTGTCPQCGQVIDETLNDQERDEYDPNDDDVPVQDMLNDNKSICPQCLEQIDPQYAKSKVIITRIVGTTSQPKSRQCMEIYGGLYVKVANYAKCQADTPYLLFSYDTNYTLARDRYKDIRDKIMPGMSSPEPYNKQGRNNPQYYGEMPLDSVTIKTMWFRPAAFEYFDKIKCDRFKKKFPNGCKLDFVEQEFAEVCNESLDDHWTLTNNPLSDFIYFDPIGMLLTSIQEITNDLVSLTKQTIEQGIPQTFADPDVLNFPGYSKMEATPGSIYPAKPKSGKSLSDAFYEVKTATLSAEVMPFGDRIQQFGQLVSGATPSLFGGQLTGGSNTASEYSMSRAQALQRLQTTWKMFTFWWRDIYGKVIPAYIKTVQEDERSVQKDKMGNFVNVLIRKSELEGTIGSFEIESDENLPMTWSQRKDVVMKLLEANNPELLAMLAQPENLPIIYDMIGIADFFVPGEDDRNKQYDEIKQLLNSEPITQPPDPNEVEQAVASGGSLPLPQEMDVPSVPIDPEVDNNQVQFAICQKWAVSPAGMLAKVENPQGYKNVLLHALDHKKQVDMQAMQQAMQGQGAAPNAKPKQDKQAPIGGESDVQTQ